MGQLSTQGLLQDFKYKKKCETGTMTLQGLTPSSIQVYGDITFHEKDSVNSPTSKLYLGINGRQ